MNKHTRSVSLIDGHTEDKTDAEIIKALECCFRWELTKDCSECAYENSFGICKENLLLGAIDVINRQQAEIEKLNIRNKALTDITKNYDWKFAKAKSESIQEFWKRFDKVLCENIGPSKRAYWKISSDGNNLVNEMTEVSE